MPLDPETVIGEGLWRDDDVLLGYPSERSSSRRLVIGRGAHLRSGTVLYLGSTIGEDLRTGHHVVIREECVIGDRLQVWTGSVIDYGCRIGDDVKIHANCYIAQYTEIADGAFLAPGVTVANDLYPGRPGSREVMSGPYIGAGARIGVNVTLLPFVRIGEGALIGAGSVVTRDVPPHTVAYGNPAVVQHRVEELEAIAGRVEAVPGSASRFRLSPRHGTENGRQEVDHDGQRVS